MTRQQVADFILHYQRITEHALATLPDRADVLWELGDDRGVQRMHLTGVAA
jgi:D-glycerate 3-kinase